MKYNLCLSICTLLLLPVSIQAAMKDSLSVQQKRLETGAVGNVFRSQIWKNPSMNFYRQNFSLTTLTVDGLYERRGEASIAQEGTGSKDLGVNVSSFVKLSEKDKVFGAASYHNGRRENVRWNENADFSVIYPYVTGDSIGGYLKSETYDFTGGYAREWNRWTFGTQLSYRASLSYRDKDPRPRNVVSDLDLTVSAVHTLGTRYLFGASFGVRKYNQKSNLTFLADKGSTSVYQMLGLGVDYARFAGTQTSSSYTGTGLSGSIDLFPVGGKGLSASFRMDHFGLTKELTNLNYAPINETKDFRFESEIAWLQTAAGGWKYGVKLNADLSLRNGTEHIFGDPAGNVYPVISSVNQYQNVNAQTVLTGMLESVPVGRRIWGWSLNPVVGYGLLRPEYKGADRSVEVSALHWGLRTQSRWKMNRLLLTAGLEGGVTSNLQSQYSLPGLDVTQSVSKVLLANIAYLSDNHTSVALSLRGDYSITPQSLIFLSGRWQHQAYQVCGSTHYGELSLGFVF